MSIRTLDGRMKETSADVPELTGEALEEFKKNHRGMTPAEAAWHQAKYAIISGNYRIWTAIIEDCIKNDRTIDDIHDEIMEKKSKLSAAVRNIITTYYKTEDGTKMIREIVGELIKLMADRAEAGAVMKLIKEIGEYDGSDEQKERITAARTAFDALTDDQKGLVATYGMLVAAENGGKAPEAETPEVVGEQQVTTDEKVSNEEAVETSAKSTEEDGE